MSNEAKTISYGAKFSTFFLGMSTLLRVVSPINSPAPKVHVEIYYSKDNVRRHVTLEGEFFEDLLAMLASIRQHTDLLSGAEFGLFASSSHQAILFGEVGSATIQVFRKKGVMGGIKDVVDVIVDDFEIEQELNDDFFEKIERLQSSIDQVKQKIVAKIAGYVTSGKVRT